MNSIMRNVQCSGVKNILNISRLSKLIGVHIQERYYAARKGKRAALLAEKLQRKLAEAGKPKAKPTYTVKKISKPELQRKRVTDDNWHETKPIDNVWRTALYRGKPYTFSEVIAMFRETHHPNILNKPDAFVYATVELDICQKKKNQYLDIFNGVITFSHSFETGYRNKVIAICRNEDEQLKASEAGAVYTGSSALIKKILSGSIISEEYDYIVCHPDSFKEINVLRGILKRNHPSPHNGLLRLDVDKAVTSFSRGLKYESENSTVEPDFGWVKSCFGRLNMDVNHLEANFIQLINTLFKHKPQGVTHPFITKTVLWCQKSVESFIVPFEQYLPGYKESTDELEVNKKELESDKKELESEKTMAVSS